MYHIIPNFEIYETDLFVNILSTFLGLEKLFSLKRKFMMKEQLKLDSLTSLG